MALRREKKRIGDMLINENVITQEQLEQALKKSKETHKKIGETLVELGFTNELQIAKALSQQLELPFVNVSAMNIPEEVQALVNETVLRKHVMIPIAFDPKNANIVHVAMADPMDMVALDDFSITFFTKGAGVNTLSTMLYTELRKGIKPELYALSTILFFAVLLILLAGNVYPGKKRVAAK